MASKADLLNLTKSQLVALIEARGNTIDSLNEARHLLFMLFEKDALSSEHLIGYFEEISETISGLAVAEEKVLAGFAPDAKAH